MIINDNMNIYILYNIILYTLIIITISITVNEK